MYRAREEGGGGGKGWLAEEGKGAKIVVGHVGWGGEGEGGGRPRRKIINLVLDHPETHNQPLQPVKWSTQIHFEA